MTDRPILFSGPMILAILEGRKTQTRRVIRQPKGDMTSVERIEGGSWRCVFDAKADELGRVEFFPPRFHVGDRVWVRESWRTFASLDTIAPRSLLLSPEGKQRGAGVLFEADGKGKAVTADGLCVGEFDRDDRNAFGKLRPGIHMPRWASRLTLEVTEVRVERLQDISEEDARAEGCWPVWSGNMSEGPSRFADEEFRVLWSSINGAESWDANPWVAAISFKTHRANIDDLAGGRA